VIRVLQISHEIAIEYSCAAIGIARISHTIGIDYALHYSDMIQFNLFPDQ
jgi:predicted RND superfamily exporter protein